jgi:putative FmdB family regulatory protein
MPIYEYKCPKCGVFEAMQRITEPSLKKCPTCKSKVERQISRGSFILKGSGWYATDYAKKATGSSADSADSGASAANGNGASSTDSSAKTSSDSKPASETKSSSESKTSSDSKGASASKSSSDKSSSAKAAD